MNLLDIAINSTENDYIDLKKQWYSDEKRKFDMIHDIICLANSLSDKTHRYIFIGIKEDSKTKEKTFYDISDDSNTLKTEDIITILSNYMTITPKIEVKREYYEKDKALDIIIITPENINLPYYLNKDLQNKSNQKICKYQIYSRNSSKNTNKTEQCDVPTIERLFARKRGEELPIIDRFKLYLDDIENWKHPKFYSNDDSISIDNYYYLKNHKFKLVRQDYGENIRYIKNENNYWGLLYDTGISQNYWNYKENQHDCYDDFYCWFNVELWADNTLIDVVTILHFFIKYYFCDNGIPAMQNFYIPLCEDMRKRYHLKTKEDIKQSLAWKICKILYKYEIDFHYDDESQYEVILDMLNYEYFENMGKYLDKYNTN